MSSKPRLGLIGYGAFGKLTAQHLSAHFDVRAYDPLLAADDDYVTAVSLEDAAACPVVILAVPVGVLEQTLVQIAPMLTAGALVIDVGSVKVKPAEAMLRLLPDHVRIVGTHPLFGPQSAKDGLAGLRIAVCEVRGAKDARRTAAWCRKMLALKVFNVTPEDHDR
ncbi:prephenate dehydrogenase/arogenate dehydrogenase family protein, partial [Brevundimonas sp.]